MRIQSAILVVLAVVAVAVTFGAAPASAAAVARHIDPLCHSQAPEPASIALLGSGLLTLGGFIRRKLGK